MILKIAKNITINFTKNGLMNVVLSKRSERKVPKFSDFQRFSRFRTSIPNYKIYFEFFHRYKNQLWTKKKQSVSCETSIIYIQLIIFKIHKFKYGFNGTVFTAEENQLLIKNKKLLTSQSQVENSHKINEYGSNS